VLAVILTKACLCGGNRHGRDGNNHEEEWNERGTAHCLQSGRFLDSASESTVAGGNHRMTIL
jgi:hypothetical protein